MEPLLSVLVVFLILFIIYWCVGKFVSGVPYTVIGIILGIIFLIYALRSLGVADHIRL